MTAPVPVTNADHTSSELHEMAGKCKSSSQCRRLRAVAMVIGGATRQAAAEAHGTTVQSIRDWVIRYNDGGVDGLADAPRSGRPPLLTAEQQAEVADWVDKGPVPEVDGTGRWRLVDTQAMILARYGVEMCIEAVRKLLRALGFSNLSPRPVHPRADKARQEEFRRNFTDLVMNAVPDGIPAEKVKVYFQDEARAGQKGMLARVWARRGTRPRIVRDHRYGYCYLFAAACPDGPIAVGHVCDRANTDEMNRHLEEISAATPSGYHGVIILDGAGWHRAKALVIPKNLSLLHLPPYSPELNPMENVFGFVKSNFLANRMFKTVEDAREAVAGSWNKMIEDTDTICSILSPHWAKIEDKKTGSSEAELMKT